MSAAYLPLSLSASLTGLWACGPHRLKHSQQRLVPVLHGAAGEVVGEKAIRKHLEELNSEVAAEEII